MAHINVEMGQLKIGKYNDVLTAYGIGSCVVVICYDRINPVAGMLHGILPEKPAKKSGENRYINSGIENLIKTLLDMGVSIKNIDAKILGGASMFDVKLSSDTIGERNIKMAKEVLTKKQIKITGEDTGLNYGRNVEFFVETKKTVIKSFTHGLKYI
ncbi:MAG: chemotaxis protein CheD [Candidatus Goldbacteria bacterium]|nr:chemotaxis protein CheD [Candidatus Goldiibacteriota bacterium]HPD18277.1 chemotaxis protein CheD [Candidatus Goldiibacteriota bacterium]